MKKFNEDLFKAYHIGMWELFAAWLLSRSIPSPGAYGSLLSLKCQDKIKYGILLSYG